MAKGVFVMGKSKKLLGAVALGVSLLLGLVLPIGDTTPAFAARTGEDQAAPADVKAEESIPGPEQPGTSPAGPEAGNEIEPSDTGSGEDLGTEVERQEDSETKEPSLLENVSSAPQSLARVAPGSDYCTNPVMISASGSVQTFPLSDVGHVNTGTFSTVVANLSGAVTGLAAAPDGSAVYAAGYRDLFRSSNDAYQVLRLDASANSSVSVLNTVVGSDTGRGPVVVGAIEPTGTYYYFGSFRRANSTNYLDLWAVNLESGILLGRVAQVNLGNVNTSAGAEGDIAFNSSGDMYILWSLGSGTTASRLFSLPAASVPTSLPLTTPVADTRTNTISSGSGITWTGIAFDPDNSLWAQRNNGTATARQQVSAATGALLGSGPTTLTPDFVANDIASCGPSIPTVTLQKSVVDRVAAGDQFQIDISRGATNLATATTSGAEASKSTDTVSLLSPQTTFTISETGVSGALLTDYRITYTCSWIDGTLLGSANTVMTPSANTASANLTIPANRNTDSLTCTITNSVKPDSDRRPSIVVRKTMNGNRFANGDQFSMQLLLQGQADPLQSSVTAGTGSAVTTGTGQTVPVFATDGYGYVIAEAAAGTTNFSNYSASFACVWTDGSRFAGGALTMGENGKLQSALPTIPRERGSDTLTCTITNKVKPATALTCETNIYAINDSNGTVVAVNASGTVGGTAFTASNSNARNGLAVNLDGTRAFTVGSGPVIASWTPGNSTTQNVNSGNALTTSGQTGTISHDANQSIAGAVDPVTGYYYFGGYSAGSTPYLNLYVYEGTGTTYWQAARIAVPGGDYRTTNNGDLTFDQHGNLYFVWSPTGATNNTVLGRLDTSAVPRTKPSAVPVLTSATRMSTLTGQATPYNGIGFNSAGELFASYEGGYSRINPSTGKTIGSAVSLSSLVDLASCALPPTMKLQKRVLSRGGNDHQFRLEIFATPRTDAMISATTTGSMAGLQNEVAGPIVANVGQEYVIRETPSGFSSFADYTTSYSCAWSDNPTNVIDSGVLNTVSGQSYRQATLRPIGDGRTTSSGGQQLLCTIENSVLKVSKQATQFNSSTAMANGTAVNPEGLLQYTLRFDNSSGAGAAAIQFRDHLSDVLDDAQLVDAAGAVLANDAGIQAYLNANTSGITGSEAAKWVPASKWIDIVGTVAAGQVGTVTIRIKALPNQSNAANRESVAGGYRLQNYLTPRSVTTPPSSCSVPSGVLPLCTDHPITAWKLAKDALPASGARLHAGGNAHYVITATMLNSATRVSNLVLTDDLTQVFKTAGWAPDAAVPNGAKAHGVYLFNSSGQPINISGAVIGSPARVQDVSTPVLSSGKWIVTSGAPLTLPAQAAKVEMWFAVQAAERPAFTSGGTNYPNGLPWNYAGSPANPWTGNDAPATGNRFVNFVTGAANAAGGTPLNPNMCVTGVDLPNTNISPSGVTAPVADQNFPARCQVQHELSASYFTIRKDAGGQGVQPYANDTAYDPDPTGLWNMVGHKFEVRDNLTPGNTMSSYPAKALCRAEYDPYAPTSWDGTFISGGTPDWGEASQTLARIKQWNNDHINDPSQQRPLCGTLYPISSGGQKGRWRSENLGAGDYWLVETQPPTHQTSTTGSPTRSIPGVQLLAQPIAFRIWPEESGPAVPAGSQSYHGRSQLDVSPSGSFNDFSARCEPDAQVADRPSACVNPTGYLMLVKDVAPVALPLTGGYWFGPIVLSGGAILAIALAGIWWWRQRRTLDSPEKKRGTEGDAA